MDLIERETVDDDACVDEDGQKAIEWLPEGDKFIIRDKDTMENCVLPKYFNEKCMFMSFVRKLYRWGFRRVENDNSGMMVFFHKKFTRGDTKKCLALRSIVKKPKPAAVSVVSMGMGMGMTNSNSPNSKRRHQVGGVGSNANAADVMASHLLRSNREAMAMSGGSNIDVSTHFNFSSRSRIGGVEDGGGGGDREGNILEPEGGMRLSTVGDLPLPVRQVDGIGTQAQERQSSSSRLDADADADVNLMHQIQTSQRQSRSRHTDTLMDFPSNTNTSDVGSAAGTGVESNENDDEDEESFAAAMLQLAERKG